MTAFVIARLTFREASRRWILWVALALGLVFLGVFALGFNEIFKELNRPDARGESVLVRSTIYNFMLMAGLYVVNFLTLIMAVLTSVDTLSGEISSGVIHTLVSKPLRRWEIVIGKWAGFLVMLSLYLLLMAGGVMLIVYQVSGYTPPNALRGLALMWLNVAVLLSVTFFGGTFLSTLSNGVLAFGLYGVAFIGGWMEQIGSFLENETVVNIGVICSLILPTEAVWRRASYEMQSVLVGVMGGASPFSAQSVPSAAMLIYAAVYMLVMLALAVRQFYRRDL
jgi:Cu-processing system permease protein